MSTRTIYEAASACSELFDQYLASSGTASAKHDMIEEFRGRFNLWAAYVGAFAAPRASLDARLEQHSDIRDVFHDLLVMIEDNIKQGAPNLFLPMLFVSVDLTQKLSRATW